jgi:hypothetical protein
MNKSRMIRWAGHVASMGQTRNTYSILVGKFERKRTLQRARHIWKIRSETDLKARLVSPQLKQEQVAGSFSHGEKTFRFHKM